MKGSSGRLGALGWGRLPSEDSEWAEFVQRRMANYAVILFTISAGFFSVSALIIAIMGSPAQALALFTLRPCQAHLIATALMVMLWALTRFGRRSPLALRWMDAAFTILICWFFTGMAIGAPPGSRIELVLLLTMNFALVTRAATVPSTALSSLLIGIPCVIPTVVISSYVHAAVATETLARTSATIYAATWAGVALVTSTMISRVIYGLSRQVAEARQVGQYTLEELIGKGGMGEVYLARHAMLRRPTAVKLLRASDAGAASVDRFEREVQLTSQLRHPNTVAVYDYGRTVSGVFYYAMEYLDGIDLDALVRISGPQPPERVIRLLSQACDALADAHAAGLIHRDVKPANIFLCEKHGGHDVVKVLDFGLVKEFESAASPQITRASALVGTPLFLSPEAIVSPDEVGPKSDLYSLGGVAFYLLTGQHVFAGDTTVAICSQHMSAKPDAPSARLQTPLPDGIDRIVLSCLTKDPKERPTAAALARSLRELGLTEWGSNDAENWWKAYRAQIHEFRGKRQKKLEIETGETVAVDLTRRIDGAAS